MELGADRFFSTIKPELVKNFYPFALMLALSMSCSDSIDPLATEAGDVPSIPIVPTGRSHVSLDQVPGLRAAVEGRFGKIPATGKVTDQGAVLDTEEIIEAVSPGGGANYTLGMHVEGQGAGEFFNLVVPMDSLGNAGKPFVRRYRARGEALGDFVGSGHDLRHFRGSYRDLPVEDFLREGKGRYSPTAAGGGDCGGEVPVGGGGGGGAHNPGLISMGNDPGWPGSSALGHVRVLGAWNDYGGTGGYDLSVEYHDESGQRNEQAHLQGITMGTVEVNAGEILTQDLSDQTVYVGVTTHMGGGGGTSDYDFTGLCYVTVIIQIGSFYSIETHYIDCEEARDMLKGPVPSSAKDCGGGGPGGPVGIKVTKPAHLVIEMLGLGTGTLEYGWVAQAANADKVAELKAFLDLHKVAPLEVTPEARAFGREALHAWMEGGEVDFVDKIINNLTGKAKCVYDKLQATNLVEPGIIQNTYIAFDSGLTFDDFHLSYETGTLSGNRAGQIEAITDHYYAITLDEGKTTNRSAIEVANTILHESIHALLLKHQYGDGNESFMDIFSNYITQTTGLNDLHHSIMRDKYILPMANALALYDGNREDSFIYENLALSGVIETLTAQQQSDYSFAVRYIRTRSGLNCEE